MTDLHNRRKWLYAKAESTKGTDPTHADTDAVLTRGLTVNPYLGNEVARANDKVHFGNDRMQNVEHHSEWTFDVELAGSGSAVDDAPAYSDLLQGCGMLETVNASTSVAFTPDVGDSANEFVSVALEHYLDGQMEQGLGGHGNVDIVFPYGDYPLMRFRYLTEYARPTAVALPSGDVTDYATAIPMTNANTPTVQLDGVDLVLHSANVNLGNVLGIRNMPGIDNPVIIEDRKASGQITIELPDLATKNWFAEVESHAEVSTSVLNLVHGTTATNIVTVNCPVVQLRNFRYGNHKGIVTGVMDMLILPSSGNDEVSITTT